MYEDFYGLSGSPFQLSPDPSFYFGSKGHEIAYSYLKYGVHQGEGFLVITGEVGAGKTTLVRALLEHLDPNTIVTAQIVSTRWRRRPVRAVANADRGQERRHGDAHASSSFLLTLRRASGR